jgi:lipopolysaccharide export LptBFGC system permease protein LptF
MNTPSLDELAKQGNPKAIADLMNSTLQPKGIRIVKSAIKDECLQLLLESENILDKDKIVKFIQSKMTELSVNSIKEIKILNRRKGSSETTWYEKISIKSESKLDSQPTPTINQSRPSSSIQKNSQPRQTVKINNPSNSQKTVKVKPKNGRISFKDCFDKATIAIVVAIGIIWLRALFIAIYVAFSLFIFTLILSLIAGYIAYTKNRNMVRWLFFSLCFNGLMVFVILFLPMAGQTQSNKNKKRPKFKVYTPKQRINYIESYLEQCFIRTLEPRADYYYFHIPTKIYDLYTIDSKKRIKLDLVYFRLVDGEFKEGRKTITYDLEELYLIFWDNQRGVTTKIYVEWGENALILLDDNSPKTDDLKTMKNIQEELNQVRKDQKTVNAELSKTESLIKTLETSEIYKSKVPMYKRAMELLSQSEAKATFVIEEYTKFLKDYVLDFYLNDIEPSFLKGQTQELSWIGKYKHFKEDYEMLQSMIQEYDKLKQGSI